MRKMFLVALNLLALHVAAQGDLWYSGAVVTKENQVLAGDILFHPRYDLLVVRQNDQTSVMIAGKLKSFQFYDESINVNRKFISFSNAALENKIYEVVVSGEVMVLRREKNTTVEIPSDEAGFNYYFLQNGSVRDLRKFRASLYPQLRSLLEVERKHLHLNPNEPADVIQMIELYNHQFSNPLASR